MCKTAKMSSSQIILLSFGAAILSGALLLMQPFCTADGQGVSFTDALFTSASAVCVTGLVVFDTASHWSLWGKAVIVLLIQLGGLGVVTTAILFSAMPRKQISLRQRNLLQESVQAVKVSGAMRFLRFVYLSAFTVEAVGALWLTPVFIPEHGLLKGAALSCFYAVSAFCNAGFDLTGCRAPFSSLTSYAACPLLNAVIMLLIIIGGIGFNTLADFRKHRFNLRRYTLQSKLSLYVSAILIVCPAILFYGCEFGGLQGPERLLVSLFQSVTARTAGFNTADLNSMSQAGLMLMIFLMLTGGSPGSTAGGIKTTTLAVLTVSAISVFRQGKDASIFGRRISAETVRQALAVLLIYAVVFFSASLLISRLEQAPVLTAMFEAASAVGTVGLTLGITPQLSAASKLIIIFLMYFGRVGGLTLMFAATPVDSKALIQYPEEDLNVG